MAKYSDIAEDIETAVGSITGLVVIPQGFPAPTGGGSFARMSIIYATDPTNQFGSFGIRGQVEIAIFTPFGSGERPGQDIADQLDDALQGKVFTNGTQTNGSVLVPRGVDSVDASLIRFNYTLPFNHE